MATSSSATVLRRIEDAAEHVSGICFKTGPPQRIGAELEWTTHYTDRPAALVRPADLGRALGPHAPAVLGTTDPVPLPGGGTVTLEPGGQVEISSAPATSLGSLLETVTSDQARLAELLARAGIVLGERGLDPHRPAVRILDTPRYAAMHLAFERDATPSGHTMMCSTAGLQVCLDAGTPEQLRARWEAVHEIGPPLLAAFATSRMREGRDTGWACGRMAAWYGINSRRSGPVPRTADPVADWVQYVLAAPLMCVRSRRDTWHVPDGITFADWVRGALRRPPTVDDLEYHISTLFPPVRPRGYLEIRYLDAQPGTAWIAPAAIIATLMSDDTLLDATRELAAPASGRWVPAARDGLADPATGRAAADLIDLACRHLDRTGLSQPWRDQVADIAGRRLRASVS
ncbi:ergothioneine biosynthesis glutamate--cysteine ligase EgtA [Actinoplanes sp. TFC3]|uniref:ergothioneine biosynthesis glutamate--cysteine ligase EgtA n=1 Tax=Actinoplanes sp. TFC3 TaxID=1710355 RepID=UPI000833F8C6|nr:ergothioneine biosynthesis glutamate--cysteine ligase EgtA [Actinoplanes sp. TFC3]